MCLQRGSCHGPSIYPQHARTKAGCCRLQEYLNDYGDDEARKIGAALIAKESDSGLSDSAKRMLGRKMAKVNSGEHDVYI